MTTFTPARLGRRPSAPDPRNWKMRAFLDAKKAPLAWAQGDLDRTVRELVAQGHFATAKDAHALWYGLKHGFAPDPSPAPKPPSGSRVWEVRKTLDQGETPECTAFGTTGWGIAAPTEDLSWDDSTAHALYKVIKSLDGDPQDGSTVHWAVKAISQQGRVSPTPYFWAQSIDDVIEWLLTVGTVIAGTNWDYRMFTPDSDGLVHRGGGVAGGHCYLLIGWDAVKRRFRALNSWGVAFGVGGQFEIAYDDMVSLLAEQGEAVAPVEVATAA